MGCRQAGQKLSTFNFVPIYTMQFAVPFYLGVQNCLKIQFCTSWQLVQAISSSTLFQLFGNTFLKIWDALDAPITSNVFNFALLVNPRLDKGGQSSCFETSRNFPSASNPSWNLNVSSNPSADHCFGGDAQDARPLRPHPPLPPHVHHGHHCLLLLLPLRRAQPPLGKHSQGHAQTLLIRHG